VSNNVRALNYWYEVTNALPGATSCRIFEHPTMMYVCEWRMNSKGSKNVTFGELDKQVAAALGSDWTATRLPDISGRRFEPQNSARFPVIEITPEKGARPLQLTIYAVSRE